MLTEVVEAMVEEVALATGCVTTAGCGFGDGVKGGRRSYDESGLESAMSCSEE